jgi:hypothetical protein
LNWKLIVGVATVGAGSILYASTTPAQALEKEIGNWVAGPPQRCIDMRFVTDSRALGDTMLFKVRSAVKYRTDSIGCPTTSVGMTLVTNRSHNVLCKGDIVGLVDLENGIEKGACHVGEFTPYRRK